MSGNDDGGVGVLLAMCRDDGDQTDADRSVDVRDDSDDNDSDDEDEEEEDDDDDDDDDDGDDDEIVTRPTGVHHRTPRRGGASPPPGYPRGQLAARTPSEDDTTAAKSTSKCPRSGAHRRALAFCCTGVAINKCGPGALSATPRSEHPNKTTLRNENTTTKKEKARRQTWCLSLLSSRRFLASACSKGLAPSSSTFLS